ncbi:hypothetical protein HK096_008269, partial [Nowakowskiella sp. JEL0078]
NIGDKVSFVKKGRFGIVKGDATKYFAPYHVDFEITSPDEIDEVEIMKKLQEAAGTADHIAQSTEGKQERTFTGSRSNVRAATAALAAAKISEPTNGSGLLSPVKSSSGGVHKAKSSINMSSGTITFDSEFLDSISDVRNDKSETTWVLGAYKDGNINSPVTLIGKGSNSIDELVSLLSDDMIAYGLFRVIDLVDGNKTIKFALIVFVGPSVSAMKKAKIVSHRGAVTTQMAPFHVELMAYDRTEVSYDDIMSKVQASSGSKSFVK